MKIGDEVTFRGRRGAKLTGVITDIKLRAHRKANRLLSQFVDAPFGRVPDSEVAVVKPDGPDAIFYTVPLTMLKATGRNRSSELQGARAAIDTIHNTRRAADAERYGQGRDKAEEQGLYDLKKGDPVEVNYKNIGWAKCKFIKLSTSGRALVVNPYDREQWIPAHLVRKAQ